MSTENNAVIRDIVAMLCLTLLALGCLFTGIDSFVVGGVMSILAGVLGYRWGKKKGREESLPEAPE